jgi:tight adherence protein B
VGATAGHVVADAQEVAVWLGAPQVLEDHPGVGVDPRRILLARNADLALLPVGQPPAEVVEPALLGRLDRDAATPVAVVAAGFPRFKLRAAPGRPGVELRELHEARGTITARSNAKTRTYELAGLSVVPDEDPEPILHSPWEGMSGAVVWADGRLVGVVAEHHAGEGRGTLTVCPIEELFQASAADPFKRWREALGPRLPARSPWLGLAFAGLAGWLPLGVLRARRRRRLRELREVWPDAIDNLASGVRAGLSLPEAVAGLAERGPETLRSPFGRFADDYHATGRFGTALDRLKEELADPSADRVIEALRLAREVGGSELGRMLRALSGFLRDEQRVRKELEARQTWVVVAARMAFATPWAVLLLLATKPEAVAAYRGPGGAVILLIGTAMAVAGYRVMLAIGRLPTEERVLR